MTRKIIISLMAIFFVMVFSGLSTADGPEGNKRKGKYTYRAVYKQCAKRGEVKEKKPSINPSDKTMEQWKRVFDKKAFDVFKCKEEWDALSEADLLDIYTYLYNGATDSPTPAKCK